MSAVLGQGLWGLGRGTEKVKVRITTTIKSCICKQNSMHELEIIFIKKKKMYEEIKIISRKIRDTHTLGLPPTSMVKPGAGEEQQTDLSHMTLVLFHARSPTNGDYCTSS